MKSKLSKRIARALPIVAELAVVDPTYACIFLRLERENQQLSEIQEALSRASTIVQAARKDRRRSDIISATLGADNCRHE